MTMKILSTAIGFSLAGLMGPAAFGADLEEDVRQIAAIDTAYQRAVERNDWQKMDSILHKDFALVLGDGRTFDRQQLLESAQGGKFDYEKQVEMPGTQKVRMYGKDTATVTALLWLKGSRQGDAGQRTPFDYKLWFTDTYVRTPEGWKYAFGQASLRLPSEGSK